MSDCVTRMSKPVGVGDILRAAGDWETKIVMIGSPESFTQPTSDTNPAPYARPPRNETIRSYCPQSKLLFKVTQPVCKCSELQELSCIE